MSRFAVYYQENKERISGVKKKYYQENKESILEKRLTYSQGNRDKLAERTRKQTKTKNGRTRDWKRKGMKLFDDTYERYEECKNCELCNVELTTERTGKSRKVLDHDHDSGYVRFVCCNNCNMKLAVRDRMMDMVHKELYRYFNRR